MMQRERVGSSKTSAEADCSPDENSGHICAPYSVACQDVGPIPRSPVLDVSTLGKWRATEASVAPVKKGGGGSSRARHAQRDRPHHSATRERRPRCRSNNNNSRQHASHPTAPTTHISSAIPRGMITHHALLGRLT
jgi:hypothetical protein